MAADPRTAWFEQIMSSGLENKIIEPQDVLDHATPDVLANNLPPDLLSKVLQASLSAGSMTPERVLETINPTIMAEHIPHDVLWACVVATAHRAGLSKE
jgi:hypothetical protein